MRSTDSTLSHLYASIWSKYRPAILQMMIASASAPQQYKLFAHEFKTLNPKERGGYAFTLEAYQGKSLNNIKQSAVAQDLLYILEISKKASELMGDSPYVFSLDKNFVLHVSKSPTRPE